MVGVICLLKRKPSTTVEEFRDHWQNREPGYTRVIQPDEQSFLDTDGFVDIIVDEPSTVIEGPPS